MPNSYDLAMMDRLTREMSDSEYVYGNKESCIDSIKKLLLLKRFRLVSNEYFEKHYEIVTEVLEDFYSEPNIDGDALLKQFEADNIDWNDAIKVKKCTVDEAVTNIANIVNAGYTYKYKMRLVGVETPTAIQARVTSYSGQAYQIDIRDELGNYYTLNGDIVKVITNDRKFMFDRTYGFLFIPSISRFTISNLLLNLIQGNNTDEIANVNFVAYSDALNYDNRISYSDVNVYNLDEINDYLYEIKNESSYNNQLIYLEVKEDEEKSVVYFIMISAGISKLKLIVDSVDLALNKYNDDIIQLLTVHTDEGKSGTLILDYDDTLFSDEECVVSIDNVKYMLQLASN